MLPLPGRWFCLVKASAGCRACPDSAEPGLAIQSSVSSRCASGAVGAAAVQLARHVAADVAAVCGRSNGELVRSLGARPVIDHTREDFTRNGVLYDVILDTVGTAPLSGSRGSLKEGGRLGLMVAGLAQMLQAPWLSLTTGRTVLAAPGSSPPDDLRFRADLAEAGAFRPVIDSVLSARADRGGTPLWGHRPQAGECGDHLQ